jgi:hypothetical protein
MEEMLSVRLTMVRVEAVEHHKLVLLELLVHLALEEMVQLQASQVAA